MAFRCEKDSKKECDGCGLCLSWYEEEPDEMEAEAPEEWSVDWAAIPDHWEGERI